MLRARRNPRSSSRGSVCHNALSQRRPGTEDRLGEHAVLSCRADTVGSRSVADGQSSSGRPPPGSLICPKPPRTAEKDLAVASTQKGGCPPCGFRYLPAPPLHSCPPPVHRRPFAGGESSYPGRKKPRSEAYRLDFVTEAAPSTYALRCADHRRTIYADSKVNEYKKPQVRASTWGLPWSRLRDSNPRPTHYETVSVRVASCRAVMPNDVLPDQSTCNMLTRATP